MSNGYSPDTAGLGWAQATFTIASGATGSAVTAADLLRGYTFIHIACEDATGIDTTTTMSIQYSLDADGTLLSLCERNTATVWASENLPASGAFGFWLDHTAFARRLRIVLSKVTTAAVTFTITGFDPAKNIGG